MVYDGILYNTLFWNCMELSAASMCVTSSFNSCILHAYTTQKHPAKQRACACFSTFTARIWARSTLFPIRAVYLSRLDQVFPTENRLQLGCVVDRCLIVDANFSWLEYIVGSARVRNLELSWRILRSNDDLLQQVRSNRSKIWLGEIPKLDFQWDSCSGKGALMLIPFVESSMKHFFIVMNIHFPERIQIDAHPSRCESFLQPPMSYPTALEFCQRCVSPRTASPATATN